MNTRAPTRRYDSVRQDWRAFLPEAKAALFARHVAELENDFMMFSVALNEAMDCHGRGAEREMLQQVELCSSLCARLAIRINAVLHGMSQHGRHFGVVPNLAPLDPSNFKGERGQRGARHNHFLACVLLSERSQFLNKLSTLEEIVDAIGDDFISIVGFILSCSSYPPAMLESLDVAHFDLTTCLRETDVLLKSFLFVLPEDQLGNFDFTVTGLARARRPVPAPRLQPVRHDPAFAGE